MPPIGPSLPPHLQNSSPVDDDEDEDSYVPELPPDLKKKKKPSPAPVASSSKKIQGPAFPTYADVESDDDDEIGPQPVTAASSSSEVDPVKEFMEKEENRRRKIEEAKNPVALKREEWMLVPPSANDLLGKIDPTKLSKPRQFARSSAPANRGNTDMSLWTETPAERQQRLADEVSGKRRRAVNAEPVETEDVEDRKRRRVQEEEIRKGVDEHTRKYRGAALVDSHRSKKQAEEEDNNESKIWEHGRDMGISGRLMDPSKREQMIREARGQSGLAGRFAGSSSSGFL